MSARLKNDQHLKIKTFKEKTFFSLTSYKTAEGFGLHSRLHGRTFSAKLRLVVLGYCGSFSLTWSLETVFSKHKMSPWEKQLWEEEKAPFPVTHDKNKWYPRSLSGSGCFSQSFSFPQQSSDGQTTDIELKCSMQGFPCKVRPQYFLLNFYLEPTRPTSQGRLEENRDQVRSYPATLWPWSEWCGHLRWGNPVVTSYSPWSLPPVSHSGWE